MSYQRRDASTGLPISRDVLRTIDGGDERAIVDAIGQVGDAVLETHSIATKAQEAALEARGFASEFEERFKKLATDMAALHRAQQGQQAVAEVTANWEKRAAEVERRVDGIERDFEDYHKRAVKQMAGAQPRDEQHWNAMLSFMRRGREGREAMEFMERQDIAEIERRVMSENVGVSAGFLTEPTIEREIIKNVINMSDIMSVATIRTIDGPEYQTMRRTGRPTFYWTGEQTKPTASQASYELLRTTVHMGGADTVVTLPLLMDAANLESEITQEAALEIARGLNYAFLLGDGVEKPEGLLSSAEMASLYRITGEDTSAHKVAYNDLVKLLVGNSTTTGLQAAYRSNALFAFNSVTLSHIMQIVDDNGNMIWLPNMREGSPVTILGRPYVCFEDMASDGTASNLAVICADFKELYRIIQRMGMYVIRDPLTAKPNVEFTWLVRFGGRVHKPEAGRFLVMG